MLINEYKDLYDPDHPAFQVRVYAPGGAQPKLVWRASPDDPEEILSPSMVSYRLYCTVVPGWDREFSTAVAPSFAVAPDGKTLEELALESGLWEPVE